eukprot:m.80088 g.80088  ORF g.80088 m.80088 type:complete len:395 (-) comp25278_c0_seq1:155-1339(-)
MAQSLAANLGCFVFGLVVAVGYFNSNVTRLGDNAGKIETANTARKTVFNKCPPPLPPSSPPPLSSSDQCSGTKAREVTFTFTSLSGGEARTKLLLLTFNDSRLLNRTTTDRGAWEMVMLTDLKQGSAQANALEVLASTYGATVGYLAEFLAKLPLNYPYLSDLSSYEKITFRPLLFRDYLRQNPLGLCPQDRTIFADEDLLYGGDIFAIFDEFPQDKLFVFAEKTGFNNSRGLNKNYVTLSTSNVGVLPHVLARQVYNVGFIAATLFAMEQVFERLTVSFAIRGLPTVPKGTAARAEQVTDQGTFNILIHIGAFDDLRMRTISNEQRWVAHLTSQLSPADPRWPHTVLLDTRCVVHQYKWSYDALVYIYKKYNIGTLDANRKMKTWPFQWINIR